MGRGRLRKTLTVVRKDMIDSLVTMSIAVNGVKWKSRSYKAVV